MAADSIFTRPALIRKREEPMAERKITIGDVFRDEDTGSHLQVTGLSALFIHCRPAFDAAVTQVPSGEFQRLRFVRNVPLWQAWRVDGNGAVVESPGEVKETV
jgi:hypothetical protein